jgi:type IV pilus assembly protein PilX
LIENYPMKHSTTIPARQRGAILIVSLLLLLVMTVLALTASQTTRLQERMAGNARDSDQAFQAAEAGLRAAEVAVEDQAEAAGRLLISPCDQIGSGCTIVNRPTEPRDYRRSDKDFWKNPANAAVYGDPKVQEFSSLAADPLYRTEKWSEVSDTVSDGAKRGQKTGTAYYVNTSRALGGTDTTETVLQSVSATAFVE